MKPETFIISGEIDWRLILDHVFAEMGIEPAPEHDFRHAVTPTEREALTEIREQCDELLKHGEW